MRLLAFALFAHVTGTLMGGIVIGVLVASSRLVLFADGWLLVVGFLAAQWWQSRAIRQLVQKELGS